MKCGKEILHNILPRKEILNLSYHNMHIDAYPTGLADEINLRLLPLAALLCYHIHVGLLRHVLRLCLLLYSRQGMMRTYRPLAMPPICGGRPTLYLRNCLT